MTTAGNEFLRDLAKNTEYSSFGRVINTCVWTTLFTSFLTVNKKPAIPEYIFSRSFGSKVPILLPVRVACLVYIFH